MCKKTLVSNTGPKLEPVAFSDHHWTGLAVTKEGQLFVNYPRWSENVPVSVAEIKDGKVIPFPNVEMNSWKPGLDPARHLICVQAVYVDGMNRLWILDPANPQFQGTVPGGPKLLQVDPATGHVERIFLFDKKIAPRKSYLNDVRIDVERDYAYMTDSEGSALVVLNLKTGKARRFLDEHPSTAAEDIVLTIGGKPWMFGDKKPQVHSDGIAYDPKGDRLYYQALTGRTMYSIPASLLRDFSLSDYVVEKHVRVVGKTGAADGLFFGPDGKIYISALEKDAILRTTPEGRVETVISNEKISWPDSFSMGPDGKLYFTTSRIHEGGEPKEKYGIYRIRIDK